MIIQKFECYIVKEVIEVKELNEETNFAAAGKQDKWLKAELRCATLRFRLN